MFEEKFQAFIVFLFMELNPYFVELKEGKQDSVTRGTTTKGNKKICTQKHENLEKILQLFILYTFDIYKLGNQEQNKTRDYKQTKCHEEKCLNEKLEV